MGKPNNNTPISTATYTYNKTFVDGVYTNTKSNLIEITEDKLENILLKFLNAINLRYFWLTPLALVVALLSTLLTASFEDKLGLTKDTWNAMYLIGFILSVIVTIIFFIKFITKRKETTIKYIIKLIKNINDEN